MHYPDKTGRHEPYESRGSRADLWGPEAAMPPATRQLTYRGSPQTLVRSYSDRNRRSPHAIVVNPGAAEPSAGKLRTPGESHTLVRSKVAEIARALTQLTYALHVTRGLGRSSRAPGVPTAGALGLTELEEALSC